MSEENKGNGKKDEPSCNGERTPFENFDELMTKLLAVPKEELDEKLAEDRREKEERRAG